MSLDVAATRALLLGLGNTLLTDDGVGIHVIRALDASPRTRRGRGAISLCDGGTLGLDLLNELDGVDALIAVDAMQFGGAPGDIRTFVGTALDARLGGRHGSVHELALADLLAVAALTDCAPPRRALVAIQPASTDWGLEPSTAVSAAIPAACDTVLALLEDWERHDGRH